MGSPLISTLASLCFYIAVATTLIMSCIRGELFWVGLVVAVVMVVISFICMQLVAGYIAICRQSWHVIRKR